jgi:hypothetical protein
LSKSIDFDPKERRLCCISHIINLIAKQYLFGQNLKSFENEYKKAGDKGRY